MADVIKTPKGPQRSFPDRIDPGPAGLHPERVNEGRMWIGGRWMEARSGATFERRSPGHGSLVGVYPMADEHDVDLAVAAARAAFDEGGWRHMPASERASLLMRVAELIRKNAERIALLETLESGKVITQARLEMTWAANLWDYCAGQARALHGDSHNNLGDNLLAMVLREPIGVVSIITPWNYPFLIISQKLPYALAAGCTAVVKPSEFTPGTTLILGELLDEAGLPPGVVNIVPGYGRPAGQRMLDHPAVDMLSFTGSTNVGRVAVAASATQLKKVSLELGGKNAQVVFADADLDAAADAIVGGAFANAGQSCNCGSRLVVERSAMPRLLARIEALARQTVVGDPLDPAAQVGAIINEAQLRKICGYIDSAVEAGARLLIGGGVIPSSAGYYVYPTILADVTRDMAAANEEIFGPVLSVIAFDRDEEALAIANQTRYGLSASIWTSQYERAVRFARRLEAGTVWVNTYLSGPAELPFGGYKESGLGRENGRLGVEEFTEVKAVQFHVGPQAARWIKHAEPAGTPEGP